MEHQWRVVYACEIGTSHALSGSPCQDSAQVVQLESDEGLVLALVVSDGAGSAAYAEIGSRLICERFIELAGLHVLGGRSLSTIDRSTAEDWVNAIREALATQAQESASTLNDYAGTLLAALIGQEVAIFLQIGDGAIVVSDESGWRHIFWPQHGEYANSTNFVTSDRANTCAEFSIVQKRITDVAIFTDGIENLVLHSGSKSVHAPFFERMFKPVRNLAQPGPDSVLSDRLRSYLSSAEICDRTDDDKTLVLATRAPLQAEEAS